jgi:hypothetical protein
LDKLLRFSDYDVFGYVASGLAAFAFWDLAFGTSYVVGAQWNVASGALTIGGAYVLGQILASPSSWLIERRLVRKVLGSPSVILMDDLRLGWRRFLKAVILTDYYTPLDAGLRTRVRERAATARPGETLRGEALFWCAFAVAKKDENAYTRMDSFLKLCGFCRNMAFVALCGFGLLTTLALLEWHGSGDLSLINRRLQWALVAFLLGLGMLHRYLKFHRLYSIEVFVAYADSPPILATGEKGEHTS